MEYSKTPASIRQQLQILTERGLTIRDSDNAAMVLTNINYYRLVHYAEPFLEKKGRYKEGTEFSDIMRLYEFDRLLRRLIMSHLEEIEISFRAIISNYHAMKYGALGYLNAASFDKGHNHAAFTGKLDRLLEINEKESFVIHHRNKYGGVMPVWAAMELFSFGMLTYFFMDMKDTDQKEIADKYYNISHRTVENRLSALSDLRNACAHYNRLYNNPFSQNVKGGEDLGFDYGCTLKHYLAAAYSLYPDKQKWVNEFDSELNALIARFSMENMMSGYGFD